jgi:hypothetical protein
MSRLATLLLTLGPAKFARRNLICIRKWSSSSGGIPDRHLPVWASRHDLNDQHAPLVTDWALAQRRAGELFIARTIILDGFSGRGLWHAQQFSAVC